MPINRDFAICYVIWLYVFETSPPPREAFAAAAMLLAAFIVWGVLGSVSDKSHKYLSYGHYKGGHFQNK